MYSMYKDSLSIENYFSVDMYQKHKVALTRFRCANHNLAINKLRRRMTEWREFVNIVTKIILQILLKI